MRELVAPADQMIVQFLVPTVGVNGLNIHRQLSEFYEENDGRKIASTVQETFTD